MQSRAKGNGMNIRYFMFLSLGLNRNYVPKRWAASAENPRKLSEPSGSIICRRNILALASILTLAGSADVDPQNLSVFGMQILGERGVDVLGAAAILAHLYWYAMRYHHLREDGAYLAASDNMDSPTKSLRLTEHNYIERKSADLWANRAAVALTLLSWVFVALWICARTPDRPKDPRGVDLSRHHVHLHSRRWAAVRRHVFKRDGCRCVRCGRAGRLECDHIVPLCKNPHQDPYDPNGCQTLCRTCHISKTADENSHISEEQKAWNILVANMVNAR